MMMRRVFGPTQRMIGVIGQGTWQLRDPQKAQEALRRGLDLGMDHVDTAELYRGSEEVIARAIKGRRREAFLVSKVRPPNTTYEGTLNACGNSLRRLNTDRLEVYLQHWWDDDHPVEEVMRAMGELIDQGLIQWAGVSNFDIEEVERAQAALGRHKLACDQVYYDLAHRHIERDLIPFLRSRNMALVGYSPFGSTGRLPSSGLQGKALAEVAAAHGATPHQVVLAFLASRADNVFLIPKAERLEHVEQNAAAGDLQLTRDEAARLDEAFPVPERRAGLPMI